jgi:hypothetical protein
MSAGNDWKPGMPTPNPKGRGKGIPNKTTERIKEAFALLLENNQDGLQQALEELRRNDVEAYLQFYLKLSERFVPKVSQTNIADANGEAFEPIKIVIPGKDN